MSESNPYTAPAANLARDSIGEFKITGPKSTNVGRGWGWIAEGFGYFKKSPGPWILTMIVGIVVIVLISLIPLVGQLALMATYYVWFGGIMLGCHEQDRGGAFKLAHLFAGFKNPSKLVIMSVLLSALGTLVMYLAVGPVYFEFLKGGEPSPELTEAMMDLTGFWLPFLIGMLAVIPLMMAAWFAPALIAINDVSVVEALKLSFVACLKNIVPMLLYGVIALVLYILAAIPLLLGFLVLLPTLAASMYVSYKEIFID